MQNIIYTNIDGTVNLVYPVPKEDIEKSLGFVVDNETEELIPVSLSDDEYENHVKDRSIPIDATNIRFFSNEELPEDRYFREAWIDIGTISIDISKAQVIHMNNLRIIRNKKLVDLDVPMMIAMETGDSNAIESIKQQKQALRDMPQNNDLTTITDVGQLQNYVPDILK